MESFTAANVAVWLSGATPSSSRYPAYWPRTVSLANSAPDNPRVASSTLTFSLRTAAASKRDGASIAVIIMSWRRWFWNMSRSTPASS